MKKLVLTIAAVLMSQAASAELLEPNGTLHVIAASEQGAFTAITGDLAQVMFDTLKPNNDSGLKKNDNFFCGIASVGMSCISGVKDITSMEQVEIPVISLFDTEDATGLLAFAGANAVKVYDGMAKVEEFEEGVKIGTQFLCVKSEKVEESACMMAIDVNGKVKPPTLAQAKKSGLMLPVLK
ncbi:hypothetical protein [Bdellovibrio sp. HCB274]|uniref:hypothetical protein n=1 Tax=Bdellovibrio sp. HCB274 TaxID=3394361 RepID=UPI0039B6E23E